MRECIYFDLPSESDHCQFCRSGRTDKSSQCGTHTHIFCKCWLHKRCSKMIHFHFLLQVLIFFWKLLNSLDWDKASSCSFCQQVCDPKHSFASWPWFLSWAAWNPQHTALYHNSKIFLFICYIPKSLLTSAAHIRGQEDDSMAMLRHPEQ